MSNDTICVEVKTGEYIKITLPKGLHNKICEAHKDDNFLYSRGNCWKDISDALEKELDKCGLICFAPLFYPQVLIEIYGDAYACEVYTGIRKWLYENPGFPLTFDYIGNIGEFIGCKPKSGYR